MQVLNLRDCPFLSTEGVRQLLILDYCYRLDLDADIVPFNELICSLPPTEEVHIHCCQFLTDRALKHIWRIPSISHLYLYDCRQISETGIVQLLERCLYSVIQTIAFRNFGFIHDSTVFSVLQQVSRQFCNQISPVIEENSITFIFLRDHIQIDT